MANNQIDLEKERKKERKHKNGVKRLVSPFQGGWNIIYINLNVYHKGPHTRTAHTRGIAHMRSMIIRIDERLMWYLKGSIFWVKTKKLQDSFDIIPILFSSCQVVDSRMKLDFILDFVKCMREKQRRKKGLANLFFLSKVWFTSCTAERQGFLRNCKIQQIKSCSFMPWTQFHFGWFCIMYVCVFTLWWWSFSWFLKYFLYSLKGSLRSY